MAVECLTIFDIDLLPPPHPHSLPIPQACVQLGTLWNEVQSHPGEALVCHWNFGNEAGPDFTQEQPEVCSSHLSTLPSIAHSLRGLWIFLAGDIIIKKKSYLSMLKGLIASSQAVSKWARQ